MKTITKIKNYLNRRFSKTVNFFQRLRYGIGERDVWNMNTYVAGIVYHGVRMLREQKSGYPWTTDLDGNEMTEDKWDEYLRAMQFSFKRMAYIGNEDDLYHWDEAKMEKTNYGLALFSKYYMALWT